MRNRRSRIVRLVGFVVLLGALPRAGDARITLVQEEGIEDDGEFEYGFIGDLQVSPRSSCFGATYSSPQKNSTVLYRARSDP